MEIFSSADVTWTLIAAFLVYFMQAGFALCEAGLTRAKNTGNILMKNLMDFCIGSPCYWLVGFGLMFGGTGALVGAWDPCILGSYDFGGLPLWVYVIFETVFCATAARIVSGSMAERTNFKAYCCYSAAISLVIYPITGHWIWGGGWLAQMGFHDFAGSMAVHCVGGTTACLGAGLLGPRIGKYDKDGNPRAILGHNMTSMALGVFVLWFCWFGFNAGSTVSMTGDDIIANTGLIAFNTNLAAAMATVTAMIFTWCRYGKPDVSLTFNASLAGLVAITAPCDCVSPFGAFLIGTIAGFLVVLSVEFFDKIVKIDDPVGAISVHMVNGIWGTLSVGLFSTTSGLFYGFGPAQLGIQALGTLATMGYVLVMMFIIFKIIDKTIGLRVSEQIEIDGLDYAEHGLPTAYSGFAISDPTYAGLDLPESNEGTDLGEPDYDRASPAKRSAAVHVVGDVDLSKPGTMHNITIMCKATVLDELKGALNKAGITGMTVSQVTGFGIQKGADAMYRGVRVDARFLPKVKCEIVVGNIAAQKIIDVAKRALYTGHIGDGKIFVYAVEKVVKVRTGEEDLLALIDQDVEERA